MYQSSNQTRSQMGLKKGEMNIYSPYNNMMPPPPPPPPPEKLNFFTELLYLTAQ